MAPIEEKVAQAGKALATLVEAVHRDDGSVVWQDAIILRFSYTAEAMWKAQKAVLAEVDAVESGSPKRTIREAFGYGYLNEADVDIAMRIVEARNLVVHTYKEELARDLRGRIDGFLPILERWHAALAKAAGAASA